MPATATDRVEAVREFNRFYTHRIGVLHEGLLDTRFSLTESRLLWELAHRDGPTATDLTRALKLDAGYLSRLLAGFTQRGLIRRTRSAEDARQQRLTLSATGRRAFAPLNTRSQAGVAALLAGLTEPQQQQLLQAMATIERLLDNDADDNADAPRGSDGASGQRPQRRPQRRQKAPYLLRPHHAGDMGWVVSRHGALYATEYHWDQRFESLVARIAADFIERFDAQREACWIAERDGTNVGSVFIVQARDDATQAPLPGVAQLRMLLVEPAARGLGLGQRLVAECERFARHAGYRKIVLWTNSLLLAARGIYTKAGYRLVASEAHHSFGHALVGETWELDLS
ncbi:MAG: hypothetical protein AD742_04705 [Methylibium sp. NZG]|nr:MAG: hypothetical protein AD742_04705 [Methylibium sp. NZG]